LKQGMTKLIPSGVLDFTAFSPSLLRLPGWRR
jgi:hypothetical protein